MIDADQIAYACAASAENETADVAIERANLMIDGILLDAKADEYELWLSGGVNFRYAVVPATHTHNGY